MIKTTKRGKKMVERVDEAIAWVWSEVTEGEKPEDEALFWAFLNRMMQCADEVIEAGKKGTGNQNGGKKAQRPPEG